MRGIFLFSLFLFFVANTFAQNGSLKLSNALIVAQMDRPEDKFTLEIHLAEVFSENGIKVIPSLNVLKQGANPSILASDSIKNDLIAKNFDTYLLVNVRGYDRTFLPTKKFESLEQELGSSHLFPLYRDEIVSITFEFTFFKDGKVVKTDLLKLKNVSSRENVIKKLRKKLPKKIHHWKRT
jgi:hypothetical protein